MNNSSISLIIFIFYFAIIYFVGYIAARCTKDHADYLLGNRRFNPYVTALAAGTSDMSSWLMMGLPGAIYLSGLNQIWMPAGLLLGAYLNWKLVAKRLRIASFKAKDALTIPRYLAVRFNDQKGLLTVTLALVFLIFFTVYVASGFVGFTLLLNCLYGLSYTQGLLLAVSLTTVYVLTGGFLAVTWVDVFQGVLMLVALLALPAMMFCKLANGSHLLASFELRLGSNFLNPMAELSTVRMVSLLGWGLGYFGQPHILVRFMAAKEATQMKIARRISMSWMLLCLFGAVAIGTIGALLFASSPLTHPEEIFLRASHQLYHPLIASVLAVALVSAIMSTISAQMLLAASAIIEDIFLPFVQRCHVTKCLTKYPKLVYHRLAVLLIALGAALLAVNPKANILHLVAYAWAGLGATLGPVILFALYWPKTTQKGVIVGMGLGTLTVLIWPILKPYGEFFTLYAIIPGFIMTSMGIYITGTSQKFFSTCKKIK